MTQADMTECVKYALINCDTAGKRQFGASFGKLIGHWHFLLKVLKVCSPAL
jgi:hypothetical protein